MCKKVFSLVARSQIRVFLQPEPTLLQATASRIGCLTIFELDVASGPIFGQASTVGSLLLRKTLGVVRVPSSEGLCCTEY